MAKNHGCEIAFCDSTQGSPKIANDVDESFAGPKRQRRVLYDGPYTPLKAKPVKLRHIIYRDRLTKKIFHFITSDFKASARTIAGIYKRRWAVELLFR